VSSIGGTVVVGMAARMMETKRKNMLSLAASVAGRLRSSSVGKIAASLLSAMSLPGF